MGRGHHVRSGRVLPIGYQGGTGARRRRWIARMGKVLAAAATEGDALFRPPLGHDRRRPEGKGPAEPQGEHWGPCVFRRRPPPPHVVPQTVRLWNVPNRKELKRSEGHTTDAISVVVLSADGRRALSGDALGILYFWTWKPARHCTLETRTRNALAWRLAGRENRAFASTRSPKLCGTWRRAKCWRPTEMPGSQGCAFTPWPPRLFGATTCTTPDLKLLDLEAARSSVASRATRAMLGVSRYPRTAIERLRAARIRRCGCGTWTAAGVAAAYRTHGAGHRLGLLPRRRTLASGGTDLTVRRCGPNHSGSRQRLVLRRAYPRSAGKFRGVSTRWPTCGHRFGLQVREEFPHPCSGPHQRQSRPAQRLRWPGWARARLSPRTAPGGLGARIMPERRFVLERLR